MSYAARRYVRIADAVVDGRPIVVIAQPIAHVLIERLSAESDVRVACRGYDVVRAVEVAPTPFAMGATPCGACLRVEEFREEAKA